MRWKPWKITGGQNVLIAVGVGTHVNVLYRIHAREFNANEPPVFTVCKENGELD